MTPPLALRRQHSDPAIRPFIVIWECTRACALACVHCRASAQPLRSAEELTTAEAVAMMADIATFGPPSPLFVITGGDPFVRPDLLTLVREGTRLGLPVAVSPSATPTLTAEALRGVREAGARAISLSIDGSGPQIHDTFRGVPGVFDITLQACERARAAGLRLQVNTTVARHNVTDLPAIAALVHELGVLTWSAFFLVPTGRATTLGSLDATEVEDVLNWLYDIAEILPVKTTEGHHFRRVVVQRDLLAAHGDDHVATLGLGALYQQLTEQTSRITVLADAQERRRRPPMDVNAGRGFVFISHDGGVYPSGFLPSTAGNIRHRPVTRLYRDAPLFNTLRDPAKLQGRCAVCEFVSICGGSRSRAFAATGNVLADDPSCSYTPGSFPYQGEVPAALATRTAT